MKFINNYIVELLIGSTILSFAAIGLVAALISRGETEVDSHIENRVYSECISHVRLDASSEQRLEWVDRCSAMAKALATVPCEK